MEPKEKQRITDLFQNKKFLYTLPVFLLAVAGLLYRALSSGVTPGQAESALNTTVPTARTDTSDQSKLGLQLADRHEAGGRPPTGAFRSEVPAGIARLLYDTAMAPIPVGPPHGPGQQDTARPSPRANGPAGLPSTLSRERQPADEAVLGLRERDLQLNGYDAPRAAGPDPATLARQQAELDKARQQQARLLALLEEYKKDKALRKQAEDDKTKVNKAALGDPVSSLNGLERETGSNAFYGLSTDNTTKQRQAQLDSEVGTFRAVIYGDQDVISAGRVRLRLLEPLRVRGVLIPANTVVFGIGTFQSERVDVRISGILYQNHELPVNLSVIDVDGILGIYVPHIVGQTEARQVLGQSVNGVQISTYGGAGVNPATMVGTSAATAALQGARQLIQRKTTIQTAHLKNNYYVHLRPVENGRSEVR